MLKVAVCCAEKPTLERWRLELEARPKLQPVTPNTGSVCGCHCLGWSMRLELGSWTPLLLRSATVGRERPTATPPPALIKLRQSASKSKARRQGGRRRQGPAGHAGRGFGAGTEENRSDGERRHGIADSAAAVLLGHGKRPCYRHHFREYQGCMGQRRSPVPSCGVAFRPERCRRITCALQQRLGMKMKAKIFRYRESFSKFYRDFGVNKNENGYRKYGNENDIFIRN